MTRALLLALALALLPGAARAAFDELGAGARSAGLGGAFAAVADDADAIHFNPAGLGLLQRPEFTATYSRLLLGLSDDTDLGRSFLGYAHPLDRGRLGTLGLGYGTLSLNSLYSEKSVHLSYGRLLWREPGRHELYGGGSLKYLTRSFGTFREAANACAGIVCNLGADPVLSGPDSKGTPDLDLGLLYSLQGTYYLGLAVIHAAEPDIAFGADASEKLPRQLRLGGAYKSLLTTFTGELWSGKGSTGQNDTTFTVGAERWFPKLFVGQLGLRAALGLGSRDYRQVSAGLSYRTQRIQLDYGFGLPLGSIESVAGSHRFGISLRFGRLSERDETLEVLLQAIRDLKGREEFAQAPAYKPAAIEEKAPPSEAEVRRLLGRAKEAAEDGRYGDAAEHYRSAMTLAPTDEATLREFERLSLVSRHVADLRGHRTDPLQGTLHRGALHYLAGEDVRAVYTLAKAAQMAPQDPAAAALLAAVEDATGQKRPALQEGAQAFTIETQLSQAALAIGDGKYVQAIGISHEVLQVERDNAEAWQILGTAYLALSDYDRSLRAWQNALEFEERGKVRDAITRYIESIQRAQQGKVAEARTEKPIAAADPVQVRQLYFQGLDHYARRDFQKAEELFRRVLELQPGHEQARNALRRVEAERTR